MSEPVSDISPDMTGTDRRAQVVRVGRPYLPLALAAVVFLIMTALVSPVDRAQESIAAPVEVPFGTTTPGQAGGGGNGGSGGSGGGSDTGTGGGGTGTGSGGGAEGSGGSGGGGGGNTAVSGVQSCPDRPLQVPADPYSPPCLTFSGDNGGATAIGVTGDEIVVTMRTLEGPSAAEIFADISGDNIQTSEETVENTIRALGEYFSTRYQFYGRSLRFEFFRGEGVGSSELLGGGIEAALADSVRATEHGAFADLSAITIPYADALAQQGIVNFGAPYPSRQWFEARAPYSWSLFPDGTVVTEAAVSNIRARLAGSNTADYAGEGIRGKPRVYGIVAPENADYQQSVDRYVQLANQAGFSFAVNLKYKLDIASMPNQASNIVAQLKNAGVTTVVCACDPVMLALGMAPKANEQGYHPEWLTGGLAFVEQDIVAQLIDTGQWQHAFGIAFNAESEPLGNSFPYRAFKTIRPNDEPAFGVEELYCQMQMLAIGIHMAGPNLNPQTFQAGMFTYPGGSGPRGAWSFGPGDFTPTDDYREIWWDADRISPQNNQPGAWVQVNGGARFPASQGATGPNGYFVE